MIDWHRSPKEFMHRADVLREQALHSESYLNSQKEIAGYCRVCKEVVQYKVDIGVYFATNVNLREGLVCPQCWLSNRNRLLYNAVATELARFPGTSSAILEQRSRLFQLLQAQFPGLQGSEFLDETCTSGKLYPRDGSMVRHETIIGLSYRDESLDVIAHNDVLEHVYDYALALKECHRTLKKGGVMIFTMPFFMGQAEHLLRGRPLSDGTLEHLQPPEYHGDPMHPEGAYTFHYFGWKILDDLQTAGFSSAEIGLSYDVFAGHTSNNHPSWHEGLMLPVVFRAQKN